MHTKKVAGKATPRTDLERTAEEHRAAFELLLGDAIGGVDNTPNPPVPTAPQKDQKSRTGG